MSISLLESTSRKLKSLSEGLKRRDQKFFAKCIEAELADNHTRAIIYANECAELRKFARIVIGSELALEQAVLRLQTINKLGDVLVAVTPIIEIVEETKGRLVNTIPSVANKLSEINSMLTSSFSEMRSMDSLKDVSNNSGEATKILQEANLSAEEKIRERFPKLPKEFETPKKVEFRIPIALTVAGGEIEIENRNSLTEQVYEYIKTCNGEFNIIHCANFLEASPKNVDRALSKLKEEGRIVP